MSASIRPDDYWRARRRHIRTATGQWLSGKDAIVRGRSLLGECMETLDLRQLQVLEITGRLISPRLSEWIDKSVFFTSYPDPRIWCNFLGASCGTQATTPVVAHAIGCLAADSRAYGSRAQYLAAQTVERLIAEEAEGVPLEVLVEGVPKRHGFPSLSGFARPLKVEDERLGPARELSRRLGFAPPGPAVLFAERLSNYLEAQYGLGMNVAGYGAAFLLDQGFTPDEIYRISAGRVAIGVMACYAERFGEPANAFLPLHCNDIAYRGPAARSVGDEHPQRSR